MTSPIDLDNLVDQVLDDVDHAVADTTTAAGRTYVDAVPADSIGVDHTYQRDLDQNRVNRMALEYDPSLVGVLEVSQRADGTIVVIDGQHRLAMVRQIKGNTAHVVCNVHTGLTVEAEAKLFFDIDAKRRRLTGWDRWNARVGAGEPAVLDIIDVAGQHGLIIDPAPRPRHLRCVTACEKVVKRGGLTLLYTALHVLVDAYQGEPDSLRAETVHGVGLVLHVYPDIDTARLTRALQGVAARQVTARAQGLRETQSGTLPRLAAHVITDLYNREPGPNVKPFLQHAPKSVQ